METPKFIKDIDFELLRKQKSTLLTLTSDESLIPYPQILNLRGVIHLLDNLQDYAVETGVDKNDVFEITDDLE